MLKTLTRGLMAVILVGVLFLSTADAALAARTGGRIGGGSFRSRSVPSRSYRRAPVRNNYSGGYYRGGGFGFPFFIPFFGIGGGFGGLFSILILIAVANFLVKSFRQIGGDTFSTVRSDGYSPAVANPVVTVNKVQVGLLAAARDLKTDLDRIGQSADTGSMTGLTRVLQESTLALLRHPEYWVYASAETTSTRLSDAEAKFNHAALTERSKFQAETLSNVKQELKQATETEQLATQEQGEYIVVTLLVAAQGKLKLPDLKSTPELTTVLQQLGAVSSEELLALEVLWTPQAQGDTLSADDLVAGYPHLKML